MKKTQRTEYKAPAVEEMTVYNQGIVCESPSDFNPATTEDYIEDDTYGW